MTNDKTTNSQNQNVYSTDHDYRSDFTNISQLNGQYANNYNTVYSSEQYRPLSSLGLSEAQLIELEKNGFNNQTRYMHLDPNLIFQQQHEYQQKEYQHQQELQQQEQHEYIDPDQYKANNYQNTTQNEYRSVTPHLPPSYQQSEYVARGTDYIINTPYTISHSNKKQKNVLARFCGQLFSILLVIFMLLLSFLLIRSFQAGLTASYIQRHNQNEWKQHDK